MRYAIYRTPEGFDDLLMTSDGDCLVGLDFLTPGRAERAPERRIEETSSLPFAETVRWLDLYFSGRQPDFTPHFRIEGATLFREEVIELMLEIPYGETVTYGELAVKLAKRHGIARMSAQAVGQAVGRNPICIIVPCHRVMGAKGAITGYGGGIANKIALLALERHAAGKEGIG